MKNLLRSIVVLIMCAMAVRGAAASAARVAGAPLAARAGFSRGPAPRHWGARLLQAARSPFPSLLAPALA